jgi:hypothetical protein
LASLEWSPAIYKADMKYAHIKAPPDLAATFLDLNLLERLLQRQTWIKQDVLEETPIEIHKVEVLILILNFLT